MNEKKAKRRRYNEKLQYIAAFDEWLSQEPPFWRLIKWIKWKAARPKMRF